ncbi:MAG TPA: hypothetical protein VF868_04930 [Bacteroidia bacterium]|jgi:hypothetical protein
MKNIKSILIAVILLLSVMVRAQVSVNVNIGTPPQWGPVGYTDVRYYYLPDIECYYDVHTTMFVYNSGGVWLHRAHLPSHYSHYDLYDGYKVIINDYRGDTPDIHFHNHKVKYKKGYRGKEQKTIGQKPGKGNSKKSGPGAKNSGKQVENANHNQKVQNNQPQQKQQQHQKSTNGGKNSGPGKGGNGKGGGGKNK